MELMTEEKKDFKQTEVGLIPEEWDVVKQVEVVEYINGRAYSKHEWEKRGVPVVRLQNLTGSGENFYYSNLNLPEKNYMYEGDLIFMWSASFGPYIWKGPKAIFHYHIWKIDCDDSRVDKRFYYFKLLELTEQLKQNTSGSTMLHLTKSGMEKYKIALPPLKEQQAIASALSDVDELIRSLDGQIQKKQAIKKGTLQQILTGEKRLPGFDGEWEEIVLGNVGNFRKGKGIKKSEVISKGLPCIRYGELYTKHHEVIKSFESFISSETATLSTEIKTGDILFAGSGETKEEIGKCAVYVNNDIAYAGGDIIIFTPNDKISPLLLGYLLNTDDVNKQKSSMAQGDAVVHIYSKHLTNLRFTIPPSFEEQKAIAQILSDMDRELQTLSQKREKYVQIKQGMVQVLLTGKTRLI